MPSIAEVMESTLAQKPARMTMARGGGAVDEDRFQQHMRGLPWFSEFKQQYGEEPNLDAREYDYRGAFNAGVEPERYPYDENRYHWPSMSPTGAPLKAPDHPTMWKEHFMRETGLNPDAVGARSLSDVERFRRK